MIKINLMKGDCLERMKEIPDKSVDMVLTDPPYGTTSCKWDSVIPFDKMWGEIKRIIKDRGAALLFGSEPFSSALRMSNAQNFKYDWIWEKDQGAGFVNAKNAPLKKHEIISTFSLGTIANKSRRLMAYYPQGLLPHGRQRKVDKKEGSFLSERPNQIGRSYVQEFKNYPTTILRHQRDRGLHPTQKPVALLEYLIKTYTLEGETVLDFTMGSGSTGVACKNLNRNFIGIERDDKYFEIAKNRIENA